MLSQVVSTEARERSKLLTLKYLLWLSVKMVKMSRIRVNTSIIRIIFLEFDLRLEYHYE